MKVKGKWIEAGNDLWEWSVGDKILIVINRNKGQQNWVGRFLGQQFAVDSGIGLAKVKKAFIAAFKEFVANL